MLDAASGGSLCSKQPNASQSLIEEMATNEYQWNFERNILVKAIGIYEVDPITTLAAQVEVITKRLNAWKSPSQAPVMSVESWGSQAGPSYSLIVSDTWSSEQVDYVGQNS